MFLTRLPCAILPKQHVAFDLHVLRTPPAFVLSQDQTLHLLYCLPYRALLPQRGFHSLALAPHCFALHPLKERYPNWPTTAARPHLSARPRVSRLGSTPSRFFVKSFFTEFYFFLVASRGGTTRFLLNEKLHHHAREGTLLACPRTLDKSSSPAPTCFCQALSIKFLKNHFYFLNIPVFTGNAQIKIFYAPPQI